MPFLSASAAFTAANLSALLSLRAGQARRPSAFVTAPALRRVGSDPTPRQKKLIQNTLLAPERITYSELASVEFN
jgi:hypothetical protein